MNMMTAISVPSPAGENRPSHSVTAFMDAYRAARRFDDADMGSAESEFADMAFCGGKERRLIATPYSLEEMALTLCCAFEEINIYMDGQYRVEGKLDFDEMVALSKVRDAIRNSWNMIDRVGAADRIRPYARFVGIADGVRVSAWPEEDGR